LDDDDDVDDIIHERFFSRSVTSDDDAQKEEDIATRVCLLPFRSIESYAAAFLWWWWWCLVVRAQHTVDSRDDFDATMPSNRIRER
jgi:hypothetical protein